MRCGDASEQIASDAAAVRCGAARNGALSGSDRIGGERAESAAVPRRAGFIGPIDGSAATDSCDGM